jgi:hypothetical protein
LGIDKDLGGEEQNGNELERKKKEKIRGEEEEKTQMKSVVVTLHTLLGQYCTIAS